MTSLIKTENIVKTYNTGDSLFYALNGVSLSVEYGEFVAIMGSSGSGKSTLTRKLAKKFQTDVLHFDTVQFLPDWGVRSDEEKKKLTEHFLNTHDSWVIDGNYSKLFYERRMAEADIIILLLFNRLIFQLM